MRSPTLRSLSCVLVLALTNAAHAQQDTLTIPSVQHDTIVAVVPQQDTLVVPAPSADTAEVLDWRMRHRPGRAALFSAILPGAGQIYNRKYWKAPIAWIGLGTCIYFINDNNKQFKRFQNDYLAVVDGDPNTVDEYDGRVSATALRNTADQYLKWRDMSYIFLAGVYILNVMDAAVDGYFVRFDVSNDLSLDLRPSVPMAARGALGVSLSLSL